jgi:hypothetical protein
MIALDDLPDLIRSCLRIRAALTEPTRTATAKGNTHPASKIP